MPPSNSKRPSLIRQNALNSGSDVKSRATNSFPIDDNNYLRSETEKSPDSDPYDVNWKAEIKYDREL